MADAGCARAGCVCAQGAEAVSMGSSFSLLHNSQAYSWTARGGVQNVANDHEQLNVKRVTYRSLHFRQVTFSREQWNQSWSMSVTLLILVVDDEPDVEALFRQQFRRDLRA